ATKRKRTLYVPNLLPLDSPDTNQKIENEKPKPTKTEPTNSPSFNIEMIHKNDEEKEKINMNEETFIIKTPFSKKKTNNLHNFIQQLEFEIQTIKSVNGRIERALWNEEGGTELKNEEKDESQNMEEELVTTPNKPIVETTQSVKIYSSK